MDVNTNHKRTYLADDDKHNVDQCFYEALTMSSLDHVHETDEHQRPKYNNTNEVSRDGPRHGPIRRVVDHLPQAGGTRPRRQRRHHHAGAQRAQEHGGVFDRHAGGGEDNGEAAGVGGAMTDCRDAQAGGGALTFSSAIIGSS